MEQISSSPKNKSSKKIILLVIIFLIIIGSGAVYFLFLNKKDGSRMPAGSDGVFLEDKKLDSDQDGLPDYLEKILGTDENNSDTDSDTYSDFEEIKNSYNPLTDKKFTEEEWRETKEKIKDEDEDLYEKMFEGSNEIANDCDAFPNKLDLCESFLCEFEHPLTGKMERKIVGLVDGKCQYTEEMPNDGKMDCEYSENSRKAVAQYYRDLAIAESIGTSVSADLGSGDVKTTYTINGKEIENPLQEAIDSGECVMSGYENSTQDDKCPSGTEYKGVNYTYENGEQIAHPICSDPNVVCPVCDNCISGIAKKIISNGKEVCSECLFDKECEEGFHCFEHSCIKN